MSQPNKLDHELGYTVEEDRQYYANSDMGSAAALIVAGFELASLDKGDPKKIKFIFKGRKGITQAMDDYWNNKLQGDLQTYFNTLKRLKNQIHS
jgi:hypothetical protein